MPASVATLCFVIGVMGLFALNFDRKARTSKALWLAVIWVWIVGSRTVSNWIGMDQSVSSVNQLAEGSPVDRAVFQILLGAGLVVLVLRRKRTLAALLDNWAILLYFSYCLVSILWSDQPDVSFKRWTKSLGDLVMVMIVATDSRPLEALRRLFSRVGFVLLPASLLLIRYYGNLGRAFDPYGWMEVTGVATNKKMLGVSTFVISLGTMWRLLELIRSKDYPERRRQMLAQGVVLFCGLWLLWMAGSATSTACFVLGSGLMVTTGMRFIGRSPAYVHALVLMIVVVAGVAMLSGADAEVVHAMGRKTDFTGRTEIWKAVIRLAPNPLIGAGFESFWLGKRLEKMWNLFPVFKPNEAHDGYLEVYLNLGSVGVLMIATLLINGYLRAVSAFRLDRGLGGLMLAFVAAATVYSVTEAGFRMLDPIWLFLLMALAAGSSAAHQVRILARKRARDRAAGMVHAGDKRRPLDAASGPPVRPTSPVMPTTAAGGALEAV